MKNSAKRQQRQLRYATNTWRSATNKMKTAQICGIVEGSRRKTSKVVIGSLCGEFRNPAFAVSKAIRDALDPTQASSRVRTLADMTPEEIAHIEARYGAKVKR